MKINQGLSLILLLATLHSIRQVAVGQSIIPFPTNTLSSAAKIDLTKLTSIYIADKSMNSNATVFNEFLSKSNKFKPLPVGKNKQNSIVLSLDTKYEDEGYRIEPIYGNSVKISGKPTGVFYGLMSMLQAMLTGGNMSKAEDKPSFIWRGMHLDVSRHFFNQEFIKKYIDLLALHKMNTFHWHLTDDQGWRIEIKQFPKLTSIGSIRNETIVEKNFDPYLGDGIPVSGFYTQNDVKEIVAYAAARYITVVPEIEMPGHALAAISAYPELSCTKKPQEVMTIWGVSDDVLCPNEQSVEFMKKVLDEVMVLFPSKYIHIGGDEVPKTRWEKCSVCQASIRKNNLKDEHELQSFFIKQIDAYLTSKGRNAIGWDEILEGGLAPNAAIMSWRGEEGGIQASKQNHYVVMSPGSHCYFDHYQGNKQTEPLAIGGFTTVEKVYAYSPIPASLDPQKSKYILGAQGNVWTEYMATEKQVEYMALPRLCALAEVLWTGNARPGYENFLSRLENHFDVLQKFGYNFSKAIYDVHLKNEATGGYVFIDASTAYKQGKIVYTLDGSDPKLSSTPYLKRLFINKNSSVKARYVKSDGSMGNTNTKQFSIHKAVNAIIASSVAATKNSLNLLCDGQLHLPPKNLDEFVCWKDEFPSLTFDLHRPTKIQTITLQVLKEESNNNYLPSSITLEASNDGKSYTQLKSWDSNEINESYNTLKKIQLYAESKFRYYRIQLDNKVQLKNIEEKPWLLLSEVEFN